MNRLDRDTTTKLRQETQEKKDKLEAIRKKMEELKTLEKNLKKDFENSQIKTTRAEERRRDSLVGVMYRKKAASDLTFYESMIKDLDKFYVRDDERLLFSLPPLVEKNNSQLQETVLDNKSVSHVPDNDIETNENNSDIFEIHEHASGSSNDETSFKYPSWMPEGQWNGKIYKGKGIYVNGNQHKLTPEQEQKLRTLFPQ